MIIMTHHQKKAYIRLWTSIFLIGIVTLSIIWLLIDPNAINVLNVIFPILLYLFGGTIVTTMIVLILLQIIGGCLLDYQMAKRLNESDFAYYHKRRKIGQDDYILFQYTVKNHITIQQQQHVQTVLESFVKDHKILRWYYIQFLEEKFTEITD